jgi:raffinose/stachyose/melibiose transport system permease protein
MSDARVTAEVADTIPAVAGDKSPGRPGRVAKAARPVRPGGRRKKLELVLLLTPATVLFTGFVLAPIALAAYYSFYNWDGYGTLTSAGLSNYTSAITGTNFQHSVLHNLIIVGLSLVIQLPLSISLAMLLNRNIKGRALLRLVVFAPYVLSEAITAVVWYQMLQPNGFVDEIFISLGLGSQVHQWLASQSLVLYTLFVVITWKYIGFGIILLREVAALDGASSWQVTRHIVLPLLGPTIRIWIFLSVIGSLQLFDLVWIMTGGGPAEASNTMATYIYNFGIQKQQYGFASAVAVILFIICFAFALVYQRFVLRRDTEGALTRVVG